MASSFLISTCSSIISLSKPRTYKEGAVGIHPPFPNKAFLEFFQDDFYLHLPFAVAVRI